MNYTQKTKEILLQLNEEEIKLAFLLTSFMKYKDYEGNLLTALRYVRNKKYPSCYKNMKEKLKSRGFKSISHKKVKKNSL